MAETALERLKRMQKEQQGAATSSGSALERLKQMQGGSQQPAATERPIPERGTLGSLGTAALTGAVPFSEALMGASAAAAEFLTTGDFRRAKRMYQSARQDVAREQEAAKRQLGTVPYEATKLAAELTSLAKAPLALARIGSRALRQTAPTAVRGIGMAPSMGQRALEFGGVEAARGVSRAGIERDEAPSIGETALEGVKGFAAGTTGAMLGEGVVAAGRRLPFVGSVARGIGGALDETVALSQRMGRRGADALRGERVQRALSGRPTLQRASQKAAELIEPTDITKIRGVVGKELPVTGQVAEEFVEAGRRAGGQARAIQRAANAEASERGAAGAAAAREEFQGTLSRLREQAGQVISGRPRPESRIRGVGAPTAEQLQTSIRAEQLARGQESYGLARELGATPDPDVALPAIVQNIRGNKLMRRLYKDAQAETAARGGGVVATIGTGEKARQFRIVDLEGFDKMRQQVRDRIMSIADKDVVGSRRTMMRDLYGKIDDMERGFLDALPPEAGQALKAARKEYSQYFRELEMLRDGANLQFFGVGKKVGMIQQSPLSISQLESRLLNVTPREREAFKVGVNSWLESVVQKSPDDALKVAKKLVGTEEARRRTTIAMGDDFAGKLQTIVQEAGALKRPVAGRRVAAEVPQMQMARGMQEMGRQMSAAQRAVGGEDAAAVFLRAFKPQMGKTTQTQAKQVMASEIDRMLAGKSPREAIALLNEMRMNSAVKDMLGTELDRAIQLVGSGTPIRRPLMSAIGAQIGSSLGRNER
jgi:hypothetical protein